MQGDGTSMGANAYPNNTYMYAPNVIAATSTANVFESGIIDIYNYSDTSKYKTIRHFRGWDANGTSDMMILSDSWRSTNAVNSITFSNNGGWNFATGTHFALYGVKG